MMRPVAPPQHQAPANHSDSREGSSICVSATRQRLLYPVVMLLVVLLLVVVGLRTRDDGGEHEVDEDDVSQVEERGQQHHAQTERVSLLHHHHHHHVGRSVSQSTLARLADDLCSLQGCARTTSRLNSYPRAPGSLSHRSSFSDSYMYGTATHRTPPVVTHLPQCPC